MSKKLYEAPIILECSGHICDICGERFLSKEIAFSRWTPILLPWKKIVLLACNDCKTFVLITGAGISSYHNKGRKFENVSYKRSLDEALKRSIENLGSLG